MMLMKMHRLKRYETLGVPEIDLWMAGSAHVFRRVSGVLDSGCTQTLLRPGTAKALSLPQLGKPSPRRTVSGAVEVFPSRALLRFEADGEPAVFIPLSVDVLVEDSALNANLFGADLFNLFSISVSWRSITISLAEAS